jgi:hypothetical protein
MFKVKAKLGLTKTSDPTSSVLMLVEGSPTEISQGQVFGESDLKQTDSELVLVKLWDGSLYFVRLDLIEIF